MTVLQVRKPLLSFHGEQAIKDKYVAILEERIGVDWILHSLYRQGGTGSSVGCALDSNDYAAYESELGIPARLGYAQDRLVNLLKSPDDIFFPTQFLKSIPVGVDLYPTYWKFMYWMLMDSEIGLISVTPTSPMCNVIELVAAFYRQALDGKEIYLKEYNAAVAAIAAITLDPLTVGRVHTVLISLNAGAVSEFDFATNAVIDVVVAADAADFVAACALEYRDKLLQFLQEAA